MKVHDSARHALGGRDESPSRLRVLLRLRDWSEWCRQVIRGVQGHAHNHPRWQLFVDPGSSEALRHSDDAAWDGIITTKLDEIPAWRRIVRRGRTKVIAITAAPPAALRDLAIVRVDDAKVARTLCQHLMIGGFRRIAFCSVPVPGRADFRAEALDAVARAEGIPCDVAGHRLRHAAAHGDIDQRALSQWVKRLPKPVGIIAWNISIARQALTACLRAGIEVPAEAAIVSWDDDAMVAQTLEPTITGTVLPAERLGLEAARLLDRLMAGEPPPQQPVLVEPSGLLHVRQSSDVSSLPDRDVYLAMQYIREHAGVPIRVPRIAEHLRISRRTLELDFARVLGHTPNEAITRAHLERAKQLLVETAWPIKTVATRAGFGAHKHFHRVFVRREGLTPAAYRARYAVT